MNKLKLFFSIIALVTCTLVASAQTNIRINYTDHIMAPGTLRVSTSPGPSYDLPKGSGGTFPSDATLFTFDWSHAFYPGWGSNVIVINKSTFDSMPYGSASYFYKGSMFYYESPSNTVSLGHRVLLPMIISLVSGYMNRVYSSKTYS